MIKLAKLDKPLILQQNEKKWADNYVSAKNAGKLTDTIRYRYRHSEIKSTLKTETSEKCAYCESKITHTHPGETDHILPISKRPELCVTWDNLTLVCSECNSRKSDYYSEAEPLVNPYIDRPDEHLSFLGPLVLHRDDKGYRTQRQLDLSRAGLFERKQERIENLNYLIAKWRALPDGETRNLVRLEILEFGADNAEYAATIRSFISSELGWEIADAQDAT